MLPKNVRRLVVCHEAVDFRKHWNGLLGIAQSMGFDPYAGDLVVFAKSDRRQIRAICGDDKGLYLFSRRFDGGVFRFSFSSGTKTIDRTSLEKWFAGTQVITQEVKSWKK